jgi:hypothetical protein
MPMLVVVAAVMADRLVARAARKAMLFVLMVLMRKAAHANTLFVLNNVLNNKIFYKKRYNHLLAFSAKP